MQYFPGRHLWHFLFQFLAVNIHPRFNENIIKPWNFRNAKFAISHVLLLFSISYVLQILSFPMFCPFISPCFVFLIHKYPSQFLIFLYPDCPKHLYNVDVDGEWGPDIFAGWIYFIFFWMNIFSIQILDPNNF